LWLKQQLGFTPSWFRYVHPSNKFDNAMGDEGPKTDLPAAEKYKVEIDEQIAALEKEVAELTGKDNKKARTEKSKQISEIKVGNQYIDACKVVKGLEPKHGFFVLGEAEPVVAKTKGPSVEELAAKAEEDAKAEKKKKDDKKPKKQDGAGISPAERDELEKLKTDLIARKTELKAQGNSGGACNKDEQVVAWVTRMNELKEKAEPGSTQKAKKDDKKKKGTLSAEEQKEADDLKGEIEIYKGKLKTEFGYSNKDIKADPELKEMETKLAGFEKRAK